MLNFAVNFQRNVLLALCFIAKEGRECFEEKARIVFQLCRALFSSSLRRSSVDALQYSAIFSLTAHFVELGVSYAA